MLSRKHGGISLVLFPCHRFDRTSVGVIRQLDEDPPLFRTNMSSLWASNLSEDYNRDNAIVFVVEDHHFVAVAAVV